MHRNISLVVVGLFVALLAGCASTTASDAGRPGPAQAGAANTGTLQMPLDGLQKGMTTEQVRNLWGKPEQIRPLKAGAQSGEVWVYRRPVSQTVQEVPMRMQEIPYVDPMTGQTKMIKEPVYEQQHIVLIETTELLMFEGRLINWKKSQKEERSYY
jgi:hypothetical protein